MRSQLRHKPLLLAIVGTTLATGCTIVDQSYDKIRVDSQQTSAEIKRNEQVKFSSVQEVNDIWLGGESFRVSEVEQAPALLKRNVTINQMEPISASDLVSDLSRDLGVRIVMTQDAVEYTDGGSGSNGGGNDNDEDMAIPMGGQSPLDFSSEVSVSPGAAIRFTLDYSGSVAGLLDVIATKSGLFWKFEKGEIVLRRHETKSYLVDVTPGSMIFKSSMKSDLSAAGGSEAALTTDSYHEVETTIQPESHWESTMKAVESMLSKDGEVSIAQQIGTMTVTDTPQVQRRVEEYVKRVNAISSKQIAIKTEVLEVMSDENGNFDTSLNGLFDWKGDLTLGIEGGNLLSLGVGSDRTGNREGQNRWSDDSNATLDLLRQNKNVSLKTSSMMYAMNGQPTPFQQLDEITYLASTEMEAAEGEDSSPTVTLTPGRTSQGFSMMIMPRIMSNGRVMMTFAVDNSRLNSMDEYGVEGSTSIQLPNRSMSKYQQMVSVQPGKPLMIAGLERVEHTAQINSKFGRGSWMLGGSQKGGKRRIMTMIILTPYIMGN